MALLDRKAGDLRKACIERLLKLPDGEVEAGKCRLAAERSTSPPRGWRRGPANTRGRRSGQSGGRGRSRRRRSCFQMPRIGRRAEAAAADPAPRASYDGQQTPAPMVTTTPSLDDSLLRDDSRAAPPAPTAAATSKWSPPPPRRSGGLSARSSHYTPTRSESMPDYITGRHVKIGPNREPIPRCGPCAMSRRTSSGPHGRPLEAVARRPAGGCGRSRRPDARSGVPPVLRRCTESCQRSRRSTAINAWALKMPAAGSWAVCPLRTPCRMHTTWCSTGWRRILGQARCPSPMERARRHRETDSLHCTDLVRELRSRDARSTGRLRRTPPGLYHPRCDGVDRPATAIAEWKLSARAVRRRIRGGGRDRGGPGRAAHSARRHPNRILHPGSV